MYLEVPTCMDALRPTARFVHIRGEVLTGCVGILLYLERILTQTEPLARLAKNTSGIEDIEDDCVKSAIRKIYLAKCTIKTRVSSRAQTCGSL